MSLCGEPSIALNAGKYLDKAVRAVVKKYRLAEPESPYDWIGLRLRSVCEFLQAKLDTGDESEESE